LFAVLCVVWLSHSYWFLTASANSLCFVKSGRFLRRQPLYSPLHPSVHSLPLSHTVTLTIERTFFSIQYNKLNGNCSAHNIKHKSFSVARRYELLCDLIMVKWKRWVFSSHLNYPAVVEWRVDSGRLFQASGPLIETTWFPNIRQDRG